MLAGSRTEKSERFFNRKWRWEVAYLGVVGQNAECYVTLGLGLKDVLGGMCLPTSISVLTLPFFLCEDVPL